MKKLLLLCFATLITATSALASWTAEMSWYTGHENDPSFTLTTADQLAGLASLVNAGTDNFSQQTILLGADINLENQEWTPIGNATHPFQGTFDGQDKTISNLSINKPDLNEQGLFGVLGNGANIHDLNLDNITITASGWIGALAGFHTTGTSLLIDDIDVSNATLNGHRMMGGIIGQSYNDNVTITNCDLSTIAINNTVLNADWNGDKSGGIIGHGGRITLTNNHVTGLTLNGYRDGGGIVGYHEQLDKISGNTLSNSVLKLDKNQAPAGTGNNNWYLGAIVGRPNVPTQTIGSGNTFSNSTTSIKVWGATTYSSLETTLLGFDPLHVGPAGSYADYATIQAAIDAAASGDIIQVTAGTYTEQLHINKENISIVGDSKAGVIIKSPASLPLYFTTGTNNNHPIVFIEGVTTFTLSNVTVDGDHQGNSNYRFQGIAFWNAGGTVNTVDVINVMDNPFSGTQHGNAIYANNNTASTTYTLNLSGININSFQKTGLALNGDGDLTVNIQNVNVTGAGPTLVTAQNGIQVWGGSGSINNCSVSQIAYSGSGWSACGVLIIGSSNMTVNNVNISNCKTSIHYQDASGSFTNSTITNPVADGMVIYNSTSGTMNVAIDNVDFIGANIANMAGICPYFYGGSGTINTTITNCDINNWNYAILPYNWGATGTINTTAHHNSLSGNTYGMYTNCTNSQDATGNYWGTINAQQIANIIDGASIDYTPWCNADFSYCTFPNTQDPFYNETQNTFSATLQAALDGSMSGDMIDITTGGTYAGVIFNRPGISVTVNNTSGSTVTIQGASPALTVTSGTVAYNNISFTTATDDPTILVNGGNLTLRNCTITESTGYSNTGILISSGTLDAGTACGVNAGDNTFISDNGKNVTQTGGTADAIGNYFGSVIPSVVVPTFSGMVSYIPWSNADFSVCGLPDSPITTAPIVYSQVGSVSVPITVKNFTNVDAISLKLNVNANLTLPAQNYYTANSQLTSGWTILQTGTSIQLSWATPNPGYGVTLPDDAILVTLNFNFTGGSSLLEWDNTTPALCEYSYAPHSTTYNDLPIHSHYIDGWITDMSLSFTRAYLPNQQTITANVTGGASPYTCVWSGPASQTFTGATITPTDGYGIYTVTVTDAIGASITGTYYFGPVHNITTAVDYPTIQSGITAALAGHSLLVDPGTYLEHITINKDITLSGVDKNTTIIDGNNNGVVVTITANGVTLNGFTVQNSGKTGIEDNHEAGIGLQGVSNCAVSDNKVTNNFAGIALVGCSGNTIQTNTLTSNCFGVYIGSNTIPSTGNTVTANQISTSIHIAGTTTGDGIYVDLGCNANFITNNTVNNNGKDGIYIWKSNTQTVTGNIANANASSGLELMSSSSNTITGNTFNSNSSYGICIRSGVESSTLSSITGNTISGNSTGILLKDDVSGNNYPGVVSGNIISGNKIYLNTSYGLETQQSPAGVSYTAEYNWWGNASGPYNDPNNLCGAGNKVSTNVDFDPWYFQEGMTTINTLPVVTVNDIPNISTITSTPVIIPVTIAYPVFSSTTPTLDPSIMSDARISTATAYPAGATIIGISYNTGSGFIPIFTGSYDLSAKTEVFLSQVVGSSFPLIALSGKTVQWEITIVGIGVSGTYASTGQAITWLTPPYGTPAGCYSVLATKSFNVTFADANFDATGTATTICYNSPLTFNATIGYPAITNVNTAIKADNLITATNALPIGTTIKWRYNTGTFVTYTLSAATTSLYLSDIVNAGVPLPLQGNTGTDTWYFEITNEGAPFSTTITMQPVTRLIVAPNTSFTNYNYTAGDNLSLTVNSCGISGNVVYNNLYNTPMNNVILTLTGAKNYTATTGADGSFSLTGVEDGIYTLGFSTGKVPGGINSTDAAQVNYWAVNPYSIEKARYFAGDVEVPLGQLNSTDASRIIAHFVTLGNPGFTPSWRFWKAGDMTSVNLDYSPPTLTVAGGSVTQNFYALASGDFNRSFVPGGAKGASDNLSLAISGSKQVSQGDVFELPVYATSAMEVTAVSMILNIPATMLEVTGITLGPDPSAQVFYALHGNELRIGWQSMTPLSLQAGEPLLILKLRMTGSLEEGGQIRLTLAGDELNELADDTYEVIPGAELSVNLIEKAVGTDELPSTGKLSLSNYPNPFTEKTTFVYTLPVSGQVTLEIYNILGVKVKTLVSETQKAGTHAVSTDGNFAESGVYIAIIHLYADGQEYKDMIKVVCSH